MKKYNIQNYVRYKEDLKASIKLIKHKAWVDYTDDELKVIFLPLVENIGRKFATSQQASGVLDIVDIIQCGSIGLCKAVEKLDRETLALSEDQEKTLKSFLAKRIRGTIRRAIDINRADMRIPEHKLNEIRKDGGKDKKMVAMFFNSMFLSIDNKPYDDDDMISAGIGKILELPSALMLGGLIVYLNTTAPRDDIDLIELSKDTKAMAAFGNKLASPDYNGKQFALDWHELSRDEIMSKYFSGNEDGPLRS